MKKVLLAAAAVIAFCGAASAEMSWNFDKIALDESTRVEMSDFASIFTEAMLIEASSVRKLTLYDLTSFGVRHCIAVGDKGITRTDDGLVAVPIERASEAVERYLGVPLTDHRTVWNDSDETIFCDGTRYLIDEDDSPRFKASVRQAYRYRGRMLMTGWIYREDEPDDPESEFFIFVKPYRWHGERTWCLAAIGSGAFDEDAHRDKFLKTAE